MFCVFLSVLCVHRWKAERPLESHVTLRNAKGTVAPEIEVWQQPLSFFLAGCNLFGNSVY